MELEPAVILRQMVDYPFGWYQSKSIDNYLARDITQLH